MSSFEEWDPEAVLKSMEWEQRLDAPDDEPDYAATAERLLKENVPFAAQVMRHLALHSTSERMRYQAAKEILDRVLGRPTPDRMVTEENDPLGNIAGQFIHDLEDYTAAAAAGQRLGPPSEGPRDPYRDDDPTSGSGSGGG